jgi:multiple sugar transport system permease protein
MSTGPQSTIQTAAGIRARRRARIDLLPYILISPAVLLVLAVTVYPAIYAVQLSLTDAELLHIASSEYIGARNYTKAFEDEIFVGSIWRTIRWVFVVASAQMLVALPVALFLNTAFRGRSVVRASILIPWVVPGAVVAIIWRFMVDANYGIINDILLRLGLITEYVAWIGESIPSFSVLAGAMVWTGFPFFAVTLLAALQSIPDDLYEAARMDGATTWQRFQHVTFPLILPTMLLLLLLRTIWLSHSVDLIFLMTQGGPGYFNYTAAVYSFLLVWNQLQLGYPSALAIMLSVVLLAASAVYIRFIERSRDWM